MSRNIRLIAYSATAAATAANGGTAAAALTGDSLQMEYTNGPSRIVHWSHLGQDAGSGVRLIHSSGHDTSEGLNQQVAPGDLGNLIPRGLDIEVTPSETLKLTAFGAAGAGNVDSGIMLIERNIEGVGGRYIGFDTLRKRRDKLVNVKVTLAAAAAGYGTEESLNAETDYLWGNRDYAVLGMTCDTNVAGLCLRGPDTGNVKIGCPGNAVDSWPRGSDFFPELSRVFGDAFIPVINSANKAGTFLSFIADENVTSLRATLHLALLK